MLGFKLVKKIKVGYSYDIGLSSLGKYHSGSHEVVINYRIPTILKIKPGKVIYNPRFL